MPAIRAGTILVTGANGFIGVWVLKQLLEHGFSVRGVVRSESKAAYLRDLFNPYGDKLEYAIVEDMSKEGAFDTVVEGVDGIVHLASPVPINQDIDDPDELILPAVNGTRSILHSALLPTQRDLVKRVVVMSSAAAMMIPPPPGHANFVRELDERDWNEFSIAVVREKGKDAPDADKYRVSKVLAERAAWEIYEREKAKGGLGWDLIVLNAPFVYGPIIHEAPTLEGFGSTARSWYDNVVKGQVQGDALTKYGLEYVDVRDLARAHVLALITPEAGGERIIIRGGSSTWQQFVNVARSIVDKIPAGDPSFEPKDEVYPYRLNPEKSKRLLGIQYHTLEEMTRDTLQDLESRGWL